MVPRRTVAAAGALLVLTACSTSTAAPRRRAASPITSPTPPAPGAITSPAADGDGELTLAFAGDVHFARQLDALLADPPTGLAELRPQLAAADLTVVNLETAITARGVEAPKTYHFRAPPAALDVLAGAGVDVVTMANNHAVDYQGDGLADTLAARRSSPVPVVGLGEDEDDAYAPAIVRVQGVRVAVLGATQIPDWTSRTQTAGPHRPGVAVALDPARLARAVREARAGAADVVVVYLHWGTDYTGCPNPLQKSTAATLAAAGADIVVGSHAHQVQGGGWLGGTYVAYGLGNFVWYSRNSPAESATGVLTLTLAGRRVVAEHWQPLEVSADGVPRPPSRARAQALAAEREQARRCTGLADAPR